jgi:hypothetical protein
MPPLSGSAAAHAAWFFSVEIVAIGSLNLRFAGSAGVSPARLAKTIANIGDEEHFFSRNNAVMLSLGRRDAGAPGKPQDENDCAPGLDAGRYAALAVAAALSSSYKGRT